MKQETKKIKEFGKFLYLLSVALLYWLFILMYYAFMTAYFNPSKSVVIFINNYNEANIEFVVMTAILILGAYSLIYLIKNINK